MRVEHHDDTAVVVILSARNLRGLLHKLTREDSFRTLTKIERLPDGRTIGLVVRAESDDVHYDRHEGSPGRMHPDDEAALARSDV
jgi:hypothetical protein